MPISAEVRKTLRAIIHRNADISGYASVQKRIAECYHQPDRIDLLLTACNEVLGGYGIEAIRGSWVDRYYGDTRYLFVNMGETYAETVIYDTERGVFSLASWGDVVEHAPKRYEIL